MKSIPIYSIRIWFALAVVAVSTGCVSLPKNEPRTESFALQQTGDTYLGKAATATTAAHPEQTGLYPLQRGIDAFAARLALVDAAQRSVDLQYYIWQNDQSGKLLAQHMLAAADRGVRVRILLDDVGTAAKDERLLAIDSHPNIEVRLFNPVALRSNRTASMLLEFSRTNRRMHNKSFNADNQIAILGGRNIGDEYFQANPLIDYADLDVVAVGLVVQDVSSAFDLFWNCSAAFPITLLDRRQLPADALPNFRATLESEIGASKDSPFEVAIKQSHVIDQLIGHEVEFSWGKASLLFDHPDKATAQSNDPADRLLPKLRPAVESAQKEMILVSPYFVPGKAGMQLFRGLRERGVRVVILTNSLASQDVFPVYAAYGRYRMELLKMGVELYELKPTVVGQGPEPRDDKDKKRLGSSGSSRAGLHAKSFVFDRQLLFVGSLNLDPRSARLNTEIGVIFDNAPLAAQLAGDLNKRLLQIAWHVQAVPSNDTFWKTTQLQWISEEDGKLISVTKEPDETFWNSLKATLIRWLPVEDQL